jgi:hypothetical protein
MFGNKLLKQRVSDLEVVVKDLLKENEQLKRASITKVENLSQTQIHLWYKYHYSKDLRPDITAVEMIQRVCDHLGITFEHSPAKETPASIALVSTKKEIS